MPLAPSRCSDSDADWSGTQPPPAVPSIVEGRRIEIRGIVQGVGFRPWVYRLAREGGIAGRVRNDAGGVTIEAFGAPTSLDDFIRLLRAAPPPAAAIRVLRWEAIAPEAVADFRIVASAAVTPPVVSIPADLCVCPECVAEVLDPANRRYRYPFANCTNCGPRFTIAHDVPYDRAATSMASFVMCRECQREYESVADRRFHAQPNACPACGPRLRVLTATGSEVATADPIVTAARALVAGRIVAIKGIGGFHLACDATSSEAVRRLRRRKRRDHKPFAVMVRDIHEAEKVACLNPGERALLASVERPIVLVPRRAEACVAAEVAPDNPLVGLLLPYSPLHQLLLGDAGRPLVMTSGNLSEEPIAYRNEEALTRLGNIADLFLVHDREIEVRCDDSVARLIGGAPVVLRRSRGYVPRPVTVARSFDRPVLACGAHLKNTFCIGIGSAAYLGPHIGDLENLETAQSFEESVARLQRFLQVSPEIIAHDLHPDYLSTRYALARPEPIKIGVQHHHAHVAAAMAEHALAGPVLGVAYDGTGYGPDGTAWGGELLLADYESFERLATFRPLALPGGEAAIRQVWRVALSLLDDAFGGEAPLGAMALFADVPEAKIRVLRRMVARGVHAPPARGVGRYFDAIGALVLGRPEAHFEGQVAQALNFVADANEGGRYPYAISRATMPWTVDLRPLVRGVVADLICGEAPGAIAGKFHNTLACATAETVLGQARRLGRMPVVLTGGCFQNALLAERVGAALMPELEVYRHGAVPPGDGGIALGQALVAAAQARRP